MTPEAQRIAIAEALPYLVYKNRYGQWFWLKDSTGFDPLNDLNAMHEAEKAMTDHQHMRFRNFLLPDGDEYRKQVSSTAAQRAEAFLRTIGKWTD